MAALHGAAWLGLGLLLGLGLGLGLRLGLANPNPGPNQVLREVHTDDDGRTPPEEAAADKAAGADEKGTLWRSGLGLARVTIS